MFEFTAPYPRKHIPAAIVPDRTLTVASQYSASPVLPMKTPPLVERLRNKHVHKESIPAVLAKKKKRKVMDGATAPLQTPKIKRKKLKDKSSSQVSKPCADDTNMITQVVVESSCDSPAPQTSSHTLTNTSSAISHCQTSSSDDKHACDTPVNVASDTNSRHTSGPCESVMLPPQDKTTAPKHDTVTIVKTFNVTMTSPVSIERTNSVPGMGETCSLSPEPVASNIGGAGAGALLPEQNVPVKPHNSPVLLSPVLLDSNECNTSHSSSIKPVCTHIGPNGNTYRMKIPVVMLVDIFPKKGSLPPREREASQLASPSSVGSSESPIANVEINDIPVSLPEPCRHEPRRHTCQ